MWPNRADPVSPSVIGASGRRRDARRRTFGEATGVIVDPVALFPEVSVPGGSVA